MLLLLLRRRLRLRVFRRMLRVWLRACLSLRRLWTRLQAIASVGVRTSRRISEVLASRPPWIVGQPEVS
nr:MAG TPA: hypothetical protein [Caudoviricetes sp.]